MDSFLSDYYGQRYRSGKKTSDIFNDYIDLLDGVLAYDDSEVNWQLNNDATAEEFESWECHMLQGFPDVLPMITTWTILHVWLL
jgi:hypothetical protein